MGLAFGGCPLNMYDLEKYRSGHNEHDWKSCCRQKRHEGSNPSHCARGIANPNGLAISFYKAQGFELKNEAAHKIWQNR